MTHRRWLIVGLMLSTGAAFAGTAGDGPGDKPANLTLRSKEGAKVKLSDLRGKIVVLNFWATWCGPCNAETPMLVEASRNYKEKGVVFLGASLDERKTEGKISAFTIKFNIPYEIWYGATDRDMSRLGMGEAVPSTAFLDADGIVQARILGQMRPGEIEERVDWLLRSRQGTTPEIMVRHLDEK